MTLKEVMCCLFSSKLTFISILKREEMEKRFRCQWVSVIVHNPWLHFFIWVCACCAQSWWQRRGSWTSWAAATARRTPTAPRRPAVTTAPAAATRKTNGRLCRLQPRSTTACPSSPPAPKPTVATRRVAEDSWTHWVSSPPPSECRG